MSDCLDAVRASCARVAEQARWVSIDEAGFARWIETLARSPDPPPDTDPAHFQLADADTTLAYVVTLDAINFGSGWFPHLKKQPGCSGYFSIATRLRAAFEGDGAFDAAALQALDAAACRALFDQQGRAEVAPLMELFARALRDLGAWLEARHGGCFRRAVESAGGSAARLAESLLEMPLYRDVAAYAGFEVSFYKRAQLTAADLALAFDGKGPGAFGDLERLTIFADNLVPHVLRRDGVLVYDPALAARIGAEELLVAGSPEEVEIRALAVHAVERAVAELRTRGVDTSAQRLDYALWNRGQLPELKAHPRHRARSPYY